MEQADRQTGRHADRQTYRQDHELSQGDALIKSNISRYSGPTKILKLTEENIFNQSVSQT